MRPLALEQVEGRAGGAMDPLVQMDVGDAGDAEAVELMRQARNDQVVPRDLDGGGLDEEAVAQSGGGDGAGGSDEELATGKRNRHRGKITQPPSRHPGLAQGVSKHSRLLYPPARCRVGCREPRAVGPGLTHPHGHTVSGQPLVKRPCRLRVSSGGARGVLTVARQCMQVRVG